MESKIIQGDCIDEMQQMEENSVDLIVTDPPYFLPANHYQTRKQFSRNFGDLGILEHFFKDVFKEMVRVLKSTGRIYIFCDGQSYPLFYYHLYPYCKSVRPLIWDKKTSINGYSWRHQHEIIIFAEMPEAKPIPSGDGDILRYSAVKVNDRKHPAEKPVELLRRFIEKSTEENDIVLDCFAGCGSVMEACIQCNRKYIMIEKELSYFKLIEERAKTQTQIATQSVLSERIIAIKRESSGDSPNPPTADFS
jgi:site-specific DNA-methyltransferase (adenine-specific)|tara:strand:+ start:94 stop:843 length:750 start_codon:yes stop_codon:yes gene_type:complete